MVELVNEVIQSIGSDYVHKKASLSLFLVMSLHCIYQRIAKKRRFA
jgi:hypothetical protein